MAGATKVLKSRVCSAPRAFARCLLRPLGMLRYPAVLRGLTFDARLGDILKC